MKLISQRCVRTPRLRRRDEDDFAKADYRGQIDRARNGDHYTHLFLKGVRKEARRIFSGVDRIAGPSASQSLYGLSTRSVQKVLASPPKSWDQFDAYPADRGALFQKWISCELWASDELEEALNIDRRTLRQTHDAVVELKSLFHDELTNAIQRARRELHGRSSAERKILQAERQVEELEDLTTSGPAAARSAHRVVQSLYLDDSTSALAVRYTVAEMYRVVAEVAGELIPDKSLRDRLLTRLLERLLDQ